MLTSSYPTKKDPSSGPFIQHLARSLVKQHVDVSVLIYANDGIFKEYWDKTGIRVIEYTYSFFLPPVLHKHYGLIPTLKRSFLAKIEFPMYLVSTLYYVYKYAKNCDLIHAHWFLPSGLITAVYKKLTKKPYIVTAWGAEFHLPKSFLVRKLLTYVYRNANDAVTVSKYMKRVSFEYFKNSMMVVPNGIDVNGFRPSRYAHSSKIVIGAIRLLVPEKRIEDLFHAAALLPPRLKKHILVHIIGDGPERKNLEQLAHKLRIDAITTFFGYISYNKIPQYINNMDIVVNPSIQEGMATANLEAMAMEKPVIAARGFGNDETVVYGKTGYLYSPKDVIDLKDKLILLIHNATLRRTMGRRGRQIIVEQFSIDHIACDYILLYKRLCRSITS